MTSLFDYTTKIYWSHKQTGRTFGDRLRARLVMGEFELARDRDRERDISSASNQKVLVGQSSSPYSFSKFSKI
jgi:hypothetical protein